MQSQTPDMILHHVLTDILKKLAARRNLNTFRNKIL